MVFARAKAGDGCCVMRHDTHGCGVPGWVVTLHLYGGITDDDSGGDGKSEGGRREAGACGMVRAARWPGRSLLPPQTPGSLPCATTTTHPSHSQAASSSNLDPASSVPFLEGA